MFPCGATTEASSIIGKIGQSPSTHKSAAGSFLHTPLVCFQRPARLGASVVVEAQRFGCMAVCGTGAPSVTSDLGRQGCLNRRRGSSMVRVPVRITDVHKPPEGSPLSSCGACSTQINVLTVGVKNLLASGGWLAGGRHQTPWSAPARSTASRMLRRSLYSSTVPSRTSAPRTSGVGRNENAGDAVPGRSMPCAARVDATRSA